MLFVTKNWNHTPWLHTYSYREPIIYTEEVMCLLYLFSYLTLYTKYNFNMQQLGNVFMNNKQTRRWPALYHYSRGSIVWFRCLRESSPRHSRTAAPVLRLPRPRSLCCGPGRWSCGDAPGNRLQTTTMTQCQWSHSEANQTLINHIHTVLASLATS